MPGHDPRAIANEFIKLSGNRPFNQMWLQKLVYMANGWNLAINHNPLTDARIEAWDGGPVYRKIWNHLRDYGYDADSKLLCRPSDGPYEAPLSQEERDVIEHVWKRYGDYSGNELSQMTHHSGTPWSNTYFGRGRNAALDEGEIQRYFVDLALAGRQ
ncbi:Panacea domain-containing protein [Novosphingobium rosa]|uniref:Panacea domain-containing protein n=1 Tax=Novosphingobium rosa TaxID=76978 RepID=UPI000832C9D1|nr:Panacea domain-containing protein [Novosphingobium rosa]